MFKRFMPHDKEQKMRQRHVTLTYWKRNVFYIRHCKWRRRAATSASPADAFPYISICVDSGFTVDMYKSANSVGRISAPKRV